MPGASKLDGMDLAELTAQINALDRQHAMLATRRDRVQALLDEVRGTLPGLVPAGADTCWTSPASQAYAESLAAIRATGDAVVDRLQWALGAIAVELGGLIETRAGLDDSRARLEAYERYHGEPEGWEVGPEWIEGERITLNEEQQQRQWWGRW